MLIVKKVKKQNDYKPFDSFKNNTLLTDEEDNVFIKLSDSSYVCLSTGLYVTNINKNDKDIFNDWKLFSDTVILSNEV